MNTMKKIFLEGINSSKIQNRIKKINDLSDLEFSVFSQWGDDGIIQLAYRKFKYKKNFCRNRN